MDYNYFPTTEYKIARAFIEEILDLESDLSIASKEEFENIRNDLIALNFDASKVKNKYKNIYDDCERAINDNKVLLQDLYNKYDKTLEVKYVQLIDRRNKVMYTDINQFEDYQLLVKEIENVNNEIKLEEKSNLEKKISLENEITNLLTQGQILNAEIKQKIAQRDALENANKGLENQNKLYDDDIKEFNSTFKYQYCPHCNKPINEKVKDNHINELKLRKESNIKTIEYNKIEVEKLNKEIEDKIGNQQKLGKQYYSQKNELEKVLEKLENNKNVVDLKIKESELKIKLNKLINDFNNNKTSELTNLTNQIDEYAVIKTYPIQIESLEKSITNLKLTKAKAELNQDLAIQFKDYKVKLIKENTNKVFPKLEFELIEEYKTGSTKDVCYVKLKDVEYKGINDGHRKYVGIMLIEDIKRALELEDMPIIFDKRADLDNEMINEVKKITNSQLICTNVTEDENITIEGE